ncbi:MAG TPA: VCBS repeat-containing protein [Jatrophihabitans sp.]|nr:VCBS repeat-containing protein [Jatrophihabitans sp.]
MRPPVRCLGAVTVSMLALLLAGCAASSRSHSSQALPPAAPVTAPCAASHCVPEASQPLSGGYAARLWSAPGQPGVDRSVPVVELLHSGDHAGWWVGRLGTGSSAALNCLGTACLVSSSLGAHGGAVETLLLTGAGTFTAPATASVEFDSGMPTVADLGGDGVLDVIGLENDYTPNFAQGHNYWATYRLTGTALVRTGCAPVAAHAQPPTALLTGRCPVVPAG